jgi:hypothetical protein
MSGSQKITLGLPRRVAVSGLWTLATPVFREIQNDLNVVPEGGDDGDGDGVSQEVGLGDGEHALLQVEGQPVGGQGWQKTSGGAPSVVPWSCCIICHHLIRRIII